MKPKYLNPSIRRMLLPLLAAGVIAPLRVASNVIGYVNVNMSTGYNLVANPLDLPTGNYITNVLPSAPDGTVVYLWDVPNQVFHQAATYYTGFGWDNTTVQLRPGLGFCLLAPSNYVSTFVGEVLQGSLSNLVVGNHKLSLLGSKIPLTAALADKLTFPNISGADVQTFDGASQNYSTASTFFPNYRWYDPSGVTGTNGPVINPGQAFFVRNPGPDTYWYQSLIVQVAPPRAAPFNPSISSLAVSAGTATLKIYNPRDARFNVQYSSDGRSWQTVASNQTGTVWKDRHRDGPQGFYQIVNP